MKECEKEIDSVKCDKRAVGRLNDLYLCHDHYRQAAGIVEDEAE